MSAPSGYQWPFLWILVTTKNLSRQWPLTCASLRMIQPLEDLLGQSSVNSFNTKSAAREIFWIKLIFKEIQNLFYKPGRFH
jgi:hypothetical protein